MINNLIPIDGKKNNNKTPNKIPRNSKLENEKIGTNKTNGKITKKIETIKLNNKSSSVIKNAKRDSDINELKNKNKGRSSSIIRNSRISKNIEDPPKPEKNERTRLEKKVKLDLLEKEIKKRFNKSFSKIKDDRKDSITKEIKPDIQEKSRSAVKKTKSRTSSIIEKAGNIEKRISINNKKKEEKDTTREEVHKEGLLKKSGNVKNYMSIFDLIKPDEEKEIDKKRGLFIDNELIKDQSLTKLSEKDSIEKINLSNTLKNEINNIDKNYEISYDEKKKKIYSNLGCEYEPKIQPLFNKTFDKRGSGTDLEVCRNVNFKKLLQVIQSKMNGERIKEDEYNENDKINNEDKIEDEHFIHINLNQKKKKLKRNFSFLL